MTRTETRFCRVMSGLVMVACLAPVVARADYGPAHDVKTARAAELAHANCRSAAKCAVDVPNVTIVAPYALLTWRSGESGGEALWRKRSDRWVRIIGGGGAMGPSDLEHYGVPHAVAMELLKHSQ